MSAVVLDVGGLSVAFGGVQAVDGLTFRVREGRCSRSSVPRGGQDECLQLHHRVLQAAVRAGGLKGDDITGGRPANIAAKGIARTFQNLRLFGELTVLDNVRAGTHVRLRQNAFDAILHPRYRRSEQLATDESNKWLDFVGIRSDRTAQVRKPALRRAASSRDRSCVGARATDTALDEPAAGLNHNEKEVARAAPPDQWVGHRRRPHRARHGPGHGGVGPDRRAVPWQRRSPTARRRDPRQPRRHRGLPRRRGQQRARRGRADRRGRWTGGGVMPNVLEIRGPARCLRQGAGTPASTSRWAAAGSSPSSATTGGQVRPSLTISGVVRSPGGSISAFGRDITRATPWSIVESGVIQVPEADGSSPPHGPREPPTGRLLGQGHSPHRPTHRRGL